MQFEELTLFFGSCAAPEQRPAFAGRCLPVIAHFPEIVQQVCTFVVFFYLNYLNINYNVYDLKKAGKVCNSSRRNKKSDNE